MALGVSALCVPVLYLNSAVVAFLSFLSKLEMNNLRSLNAPDSSIPTAPTSNLIDPLETASAIGQRLAGEIADPRIVPAFRDVVVEPPSLVLATELAGNLG